MRRGVQWQRRKKGAQLRRVVVSHPLRRRADRIRIASWVLAAPAAVAVTAGAVGVGAWVFDSVRDPDRTVRATTAGPAYLRAPDRYDPVSRWLVPVSWSDESGVAHRGTLKVSAQLAAGVPIDAGLAPDGTLRHQPPPKGDAWVRGTLAGLAVGASGAVAVGGSLRLSGRAAERVRLRSWDNAWALWAGQLPDREDGR